jgi:hypothetical protein
VVLFAHTLTDGMERSSRGKGTWPMTYKYHQQELLALHTEAMDSCLEITAARYKIANRMSIPVLKMNLLISLGVKIDLESWQQDRVC